MAKGLGQRRCVVSDGYGSTRAKTTWISSDGTTTDHDPDTEMGFWVRLFHNECDRSHFLEQELERLQAENRAWNERYNHLFHLCQSMGWIPAKGVRDE